MGVPKRKRSKTRQRKTRMHIFLESPTLTHCPKCGKPVLPHTVCQHCGFYKRKERKKREKEIKKREKEEKRELKKKPLSLEELSRK